MIEYTNTDIKKRKYELHQEIQRRQPSYNHSISTRCYERSKDSLGLNSSKSSKPIKHKEKVLNQIIKEVKTFDILPELYRRDNKIQNTCDRDLIKRFLFNELPEDDVRTYFVSLSCSHPNPTTLKNIVKKACQYAEENLHPEYNKHHIRNESLLPKIDCHICKQETYHLHIYFWNMKFKDFLCYINCLSYLFIKVYPYALRPVEYHNLIDEDIGNLYAEPQSIELLTEKEIFRIKRSILI